MLVNSFSLGSKIAFLGFAFLLTYSCVSAELVHHYSCTHQPNKNCTVENVHVDPCPEAAVNESCLLVRGTNASIIFDFSPQFGARELRALTYSSTFLIDLPLPGMNQNGCTYTQCPLVPGRKQTLNFNMELLDYYPPGPYTVKWRLWNELNEECCFLIKIVIA